MNDLFKKTDVTFDTFIKIYLLCVTNVTFTEALNAGMSILEALEYKLLSTVGHCFLGIIIISINKKMETETQEHSESVDIEKKEEKDNYWAIAGILFLIGFVIVGLNGLAIWLIGSWYPVAFGLGILAILGGLIASIGAIFSKKGKD